MIATPVKVLSSSDLVGRASREAVIATLGDLASKRLRRSWPWLKDRHPYRRADVTKALGGTVDSVRLAEYISSSAILHMVDGWGYLSQSFRSLLVGQRETAIHLAYYAELRAAMSLLASEGVGVFQNRHFAVDNKLDIAVWNGKQTHPAAWSLLNDWADDAGRAGSLLDGPVVESLTLKEWLELANPAKLPGRTSKEWLGAWSLDLKEADNDRGLRNEVSYRPWGIRAPDPRPISPREHIVSAVSDAWEMLEPGNSASSITLDTHLLLHALEKAMPPGGKWESLIDRLRGAASSPLIATLETGHNANHAFFGFASKPLNDRVLDPRPILARAILLLRIASGSVRLLLTQSSVGQDDLRFWLAGYGRDSGLWATTPLGGGFADLWADVKEAIESVDLEPGPGSIEDVSKVFGAEPMLSQFTRVPLWLLPA